MVLFGTATAVYLFLANITQKIPTFQNSKIYNTSTTPIHIILKSHLAAFKGYELPAIQSMFLKGGGGGGVWGVSGCGKQCC